MSRPNVPLVPMLWLLLRPGAQRRAARNALGRPPIALAIHGGAGVIEPREDDARKGGLRTAPASPRRSMPATRSSSAAARASMR